MRGTASPRTASRRGAARLVTLPALKWEAVACNIDELDAFLKKLNKKKHKSEADLRKKGVRVHCPTLPKPSTKPTSCTFGKWIIMYKKPFFAFIIMHFPKN